jgi:hypothetical protein
MSLDIFAFARSVAKISDALMPDLGDLVQQGARALGLPSALGELAAGALNVATGNYGAALINGVEVITDGMESAGPKRSVADQLDQVVRKRVDPGPPPPPGSSPAPAHFATASLSALPDSLASWRLTPPAGPKVAQQPWIGKPPQATPDGTDKPDGAGKPDGADKPDGAGKPDKPRAEAATATDAPKPALAPPELGKPGKPDATPRPAGRKDGSGDAIDFSEAIGKSNLDLLKNLAEGKIPPGSLNDPAAMLDLQQRISKAQEMFTLLSTLLRTLHEMKMGMIANCRA